MQKGHAEELVVCAPGLPGVIVLFGFGLVRTGEVRPVTPVEEILELHSEWINNGRISAAGDKGKVQEGGNEAVTKFATHTALERSLARSRHIDAGRVNGCICNYALIDVTHEIAEPKPLLPALNQKVFI
jgi:hypothetical protein